MKIEKPVKITRIIPVLQCDKMVALVYFKQMDNEEQYAAFSLENKKKTKSFIYMMNEVLGKTAETFEFHKFPETSAILMIDTSDDNVMYFAPEKNDEPDETDMQLKMIDEIREAKEEIKKNKKKK